MIEKSFAEGGISMPFPQRDVHLDTSRPVQVELTRQSA
jgi:small-conductance mechanosensitive channel